MAIDVVVLMGVTAPGRSVAMTVRLAIGFRLQPVLHVGALGPRVEKTGIEEQCRIDSTVLRDDLRGGRVQDPQTFLQSAQVIEVGEIGLGQQQAVGHRRLLDGLDLAIERIVAIDCIDRGDDSVQAIAPRND